MAARPPAVRSSAGQWPGRRPMAAVRAASGGWDVVTNGCELASGTSGSELASLAMAAGGLTQSAVSVTRDARVLRTSRRRADGPTTAYGCTSAISVGALIQQLWLRGRPLWPGGRLRRSYADGGLFSRKSLCDARAAAASLAARRAVTGPNASTLAVPGFHGNGRGRSTMAACWIDFVDGERCSPYVQLH
eukprot:9469730-Pyramimonas_sp.AAC.1